MSEYTIAARYADASSDHLSEGIRIFLIVSDKSGVMVTRKYCFIAFSEDLLLFGEVFTSISELAVYVGKIC